MPSNQADFLYLNIMENYSLDARLYNEALEMYSRTTERYHFNEKLSTSSN